MLASGLFQTQTLGTMITKEVILKEKKYPVAFDMQTILGYEEIAGKPFFGQSLEMMTDRIALLCASILSADEKNDIDIKELLTTKDKNLIIEIALATAVVIKMANDFFASDDDKKDGDGTQIGETSKN